MTTKEPKYTPGNWVQNGMNGVHTQSGSPIAITDGENRLANAKLISAAPDLLEALQDLITNQIYTTERCMNLDISKARAAIQKALTL